jgi:hypothetical protein
MAMSRCQSRTRFGSQRIPRNKAVAGKLNGQRTEKMSGDRKRIERAERPPSRG